MELLEIKIEVSSKN